MITAVPQSISRLCQGAFWALSVTLIMVSYSFVLQPAFDPPVEEILTHSADQEITTEGAVVLQHLDGTFSLMIDDKTVIRLKDEVAKMYIEAGYPAIKEG